MKNILIQEKSTLRLTFKPELASTGFWTLRKLARLITRYRNIFPNISEGTAFPLQGAAIFSHPEEGRPYLPKYLVNKPLQAAGMSGDNVRDWDIARKNEHLAEKRSFEGKCEILRTISQPRTLWADIPASQKGDYLFYNPPINFYFAIKPPVNMVKKSVVIWWRMRVIEVRE